MTAGEGGRPGNGTDNDTGNGAGQPVDIRQISELQVAYIMKNFPQDASVYPPRQGKEPGPDPVEFIYRRGHLLTRDQDLQAVLSILDPPRITITGDDPGPALSGEVSHPIPGLALVELTGGGNDPVAEARILFGALAAIERQLGPGKAGPDHMMSVTGPPPPATWCPATEPDLEPADAAPWPGISRSCCDGRGTRVAVVDTGLVKEETARHPWLYGVDGEADLLVADGTIGLYGGHGTFVASIVRAMAPRAEVRVARVFDKGGALYESDIVKALLSVLDWAPDVISLSAGTHTWNHRGLLSFHVFVDGPLRECCGTVLVAAAGNDGLDWKFSPAEMDGVIGVGALGPGDARAWFSDYGDWVKVYAPGQDLVHAFARGCYTYHEMRSGQAEFSGMARWSGTSFSTPVVSGLVAARMSGTGEGAHQAAQSLLRLARAQALPGVGPVLHPGQACLCACGQPGRCGGEHPGRCGCGHPGRCGCGHPGP